VGQTRAGRRWRSRVGVSVFRGRALETTVLLQLAEVLVARALDNAIAPVPVLLNLLVWKPEFGVGGLSHALEM